MRAPFALLLLAACGGGDASDAVDASSADAASCVTTTACTTDSDCNVEPGTRCNTALPSPRCQPLECGYDGLPCGGPEFCEPGLLCFDETHFGESATIYKAGVCSPATDTRAACTTRCMQAFAQSQGMVLDECTQPEATALCQDVCSRYPAWDTCESYFDTYNANDWRFGYMNCPRDNLCPFVGVRCGSTDINLEHEINGCL
jgi:hypothetical protein